MQAPPDLVKRFWSTFTLDRGILIDYRAPTDDRETFCVEHSLRPAWIVSTFRFRPIQDCSADELKKCFKKQMALVLGIERAQIDKPKYEAKGNPVMYQVSCKIRTLSHFPATDEVKHLVAKVTAVNDHCISGNRWWTDRWDGWTLVQAKGTKETDGIASDHKPSAPRNYCLQVPLKLNDIHAKRLNSASYRDKFMCELADEFGVPRSYLVWMDLTQKQDATYSYYRHHQPPK